MSRTSSLLNRVVTLGCVLTGERVIWKLTPSRSGDRHIYEVATLDTLYGPDAAHRFLREVFGFTAADLFLAALSGAPRSTNAWVSPAHSTVADVTVSVTWNPALMIETRHHYRVSRPAPARRRFTGAAGNRFSEQDLPQVRACARCLPDLLLGLGAGLYGVVFLPQCTTDCG